MRVFYLVPDHGRTGDETLLGYLWRRLRRRQLPMGGVKIIYQHIELLRKNGIEAYAVHIRPFRVDWFKHQIKPISLKKAEAMAGDEDLWVVPEVLPYMGGNRRVLFAQNPGAIDPFLIPGDSYQSLGYESVITCGPVPTAAVAAREQLPIFTINNGIDLSVFCDSDRREAGRVVYLARRNVEYARRAAKKLADKGTFVELPPNLSQKEMVAAFQRADVVLLVGFPEGTPLPPMEAMACGAAVVGFTGGGGATHMIDGKTALVAPDGDQAALEACLERILTDAPLKEQIRAGGKAHIKDFGLDAMERDLMAWLNAEPVAPVPTQKRMSCAVGIVTYGRPRLVERCVASLQNQIRPPDQIIVADASEEEPNLPEGVTYIRCERGMTRQRNRLLKEVTSDVILFLDDDTIAHPSLIERLMRVWETGEQFACVQAAVIEGAPTPPSHKRPIGLFAKIGRFLRLSLQGKIHALRCAYVGPFFPKERLQVVHGVPHDLQYWPLEAVRTAYGCAMSFRDPPHFNELFETYAFLEDFEATYPMGFRAPIAVVHNAAVRHLKETSGRIDPAQVHAFYLLNMAYIARKHMPGSEEHIRRHHKRYVRLEKWLAPFRKKGFSQYRGAKRGLEASLQLLEAPPDRLDNLYSNLIQML